MDRILAAPLTDLRRAPALLPEVQSLNAAHAVQTGPLDREDLEALLTMSLAAPASTDASGRLLGFAIVLPEGADYASPNYAWIASRLRSFVYVDRVIVAASARGRGIGRALYGAAASAARSAGLAWIACEVNAQPPNPESDAFHAALGFVAIGTAHQPSRGKTMRYLALPLGDQP